MDKPELDSEECLICDRVGTEEFYQQLRTFGFDPKLATLTLKVMAKIYFKDHTFFAGKRRSTIKAFMAYLTVRFYREFNPTGEIEDNNGKDVEQATQREVAKHFDSHDVSIWELFKMLKRPVFLNLYGEIVKAYLGSNYLEIKGIDGRIEYVLDDVWKIRGREYKGNSG